MDNNVSLALWRGSVDSHGRDKAFAPFKDGIVLEWMRDRLGSVVSVHFRCRARTLSFHDLGCQ
jgi:molybdopterin-guanine dinucleotide biosynthesis protein A